MGESQQCGDNSLACLACAAKFAKWKREMEMIASEVSHLFEDHEVFKGVVALMQQNRIYEFDGTFYKWVGFTYMEVISMRVRRLVDGRAGTYSLAVLLNDIADNPGVLSRERFIDPMVRADERAEPYAHEHFDALVGKDAAHVDEAVVRADRETLVAATKKFKAVADKRFGHYDKREMERRDAPTWGECDQIVAEIVRVTRKYRPLILMVGNTWPRQLPATWTHVFKTPWVKADEQPENR